MASFVTNKGAYELGSGRTDYENDPIQALLVVSSHTAARTHNWIDDISAEEVTVSGYSRQTLGAKTVTEDDGSHQVEYSSANLEFGALAAGETVGGAYLFRDTGDPATSPVLAFLDFTDTPTNGSTFTLTPNAEGWFKLSTA